MVFGQGINEPKNALRREAGHCRGESQSKFYLDHQNALFLDLDHSNASVSFFGPLKLYIKGRTNSIWKVE